MVARAKLSKFSVFKKTAKLLAFIEKYEAVETGATPSPPTEASVLLNDT